MSEFDEKAATWDDDPARVKRAEEIAVRVKSTVDLSQVTKALEYGSGTGLMSFALKDDIHKITMMDDSVEMTRVAQQKIMEREVTNMKPVHGDLMQGPLPDERFDFIFTMLTLHHVDDVEELLRKFRSLLTSQGKLAIIDLDKEDGSFHDGPFHGHKGFDRIDMEGKLKNSGFEPVHYEICHHIEKETEKSIKDYPVFLMVAELDQANLVGKPDT